MTARLLLLRHAKSSWDDASIHDRDRPLAKRGRKAARLVGAHLRASSLLPDLVLCSAAVRARETLERLELPDAQARIEDRLYAAGGPEILACIRDEGAAAATLLVIGHNPGVHDLAVELAGGEHVEAAERLRDGFPTGAIAVFDVEGAWSSLAPGRARLASFVSPRELG
jgi:phosphohistidine phosphatase